MVALYQTWQTLFETEEASKNHLKYVIGVSLSEKSHGHSETKQPLWAPVFIYETW